MNKKVKFLMFELKGDYGFFKKPETTTSPISFYFPPRTAIVGIIAAIMGEPKDNYHESICYSEKNCKLALRINNKISSIIYSTNVAEFSGPLIKNSAPTKYTFLKNPDYTIFVHLSDKEKHKELAERLKNKDFIYNISLGIANLFARVENLREIEFEELSNSEKKGFIAIASIIPYLKGTNKLIKDGGIQFEGEILKTNMPRLMNKDREVEEYCTYIYERNGHLIQINPENDMEIYCSEKENFIVI